MPEVEWLGVIERQQQEIELLRQELAASSLEARACLSPLLERSGSDASSVASLAFSVVSMREDSELRMDSEQYARICEKVERMRAALARKAAKLRKARAQRSEGQKEEARLRDAMANLGSEVETQRAQVAREVIASQDAVDKAVEKAAQALLKNDLLTAEVSKLQEEICVRSNSVKAANAAQEEMEKQLLQTRREAVRLATDVRALQKDNSSLQSSLRVIQQELAPKRQDDLVRKELSVQRQMLQQRVSELEAIVQQQSAQLSQQTRLIDQEQEQIKQLKQDQVLSERAAAVEHAEDQRHAAHLLKSTITLQHALEDEQVCSLKLQNRVREESETSQMLAEDLLQANLKVARRDQELQQRGGKYYKLLNEYRQLTRHTQAVQASERELVSVLIPTKKRLALLQETLTRFCYELEGVSRQMMTSRNREVSLGRALREYGKRNRELQASVFAARQQIHSVAGAFRSSEKRKEQAISANWTLKRDLVVERCQRTDLVRQCKELESCLDSCQTSASETQARAEGLQEDNGILQHAVAQLVAYAKELQTSQRALQEELTKLEVTGKRVPAVYG
ncbi:hypothetical protein V7S43_014709 [Phytophthora oleae]|uniref:Uncharacterized protein n=1 Tax=Phytophthora oleae TaxID=2107226 RepID=A0ABD3F061_9STRA